MSDVYALVAAEIIMKTMLDKGERFAKEIMTTTGLCLRERKQRKKKGKKNYLQVHDLPHRGEL
jgi:hypothetical protein